MVLNLKPTKNVVCVYTILEHNCLLTENPQVLQELVGATMIMG